MGGMSDESAIQTALEVVLRRNAPQAILTGWQVIMSYVEPGDMELGQTGYVGYGMEGQPYHASVGLGRVLVGKLEGEGL